MNILVLPNDIGGGFGHISRCLSLAHEASLRGHQCSLVFTKSKFEEKINGKFRIFYSQITPTWKHVVQKLRKKIPNPFPMKYPIFIRISGLDYQVIRDGLVNEAIVIKAISEYMMIVKQCKPDVIVGDTNLLAWILAKKTDIPVVQIVQSVYHPVNGKLIWWESGNGGQVQPKSSLLFNPILEKMKIETIGRGEDLLRGDLYIIPSIPELEPVEEEEKTIFVGLLRNREPEDKIPPWINELDNKQPVVYITIGGGAGFVGNKQFFSTIVEAFADKPLQIVVSTSKKYDDIRFLNLSKNIKFFTWVPGDLLTSKADLVIFHGGYGTMMECITSGKPTITIPFHSEQEGNGRRLEQLGCGRVLKLSVEDYKEIRAKWKYGTYSFLAQFRYDLTPKDLIDEVYEVLLNKKYLSNAQNLQAKMKQYHGAEEVLDLIEKRWA